MTMDIQFETFLRKDIFPHDQGAVDLIMNIYQDDPKEQRYIYGVMESYRQGLISHYESWKYLMQNIVLKYKRQYECMGKYLDEEYQDKMKGGK